MLVMTAKVLLILSVGVYHLLGV